MKQLGDGNLPPGLLPVPIGTITFRTPLGVATASLEAYNAAPDAVLIVVRQEHGGLIQRKDVIRCLEAAKIARPGTPVLFLHRGQTIDMVNERELVEAGWCRKATADLLGGATAEDAYKKGFAAGLRHAARSGYQHAAPDLLLGAGDAPALDPDEAPLLALSPGDGETIMDAYVEFENE